MNKIDLTKTLANEKELPVRKAEEIVDMFFKTIHSALVDNDRIEFRGFGAFSVKRYEGYTGRNPRTGEKITVKPKALPFFKAGKDLREKLRK